MICPCCDKEIKDTEHVTINRRWTICYTCFFIMRQYFESRNQPMKLHSVNYYIKTKGTMKNPDVDFVAKYVKFW